MSSLGAVTSHICNHKIHLLSRNDQVRQLRDFLSNLRGEVLKHLSVRNTGRPSAANVYQKARAAKDRAKAANTAHEESNKIYVMLKPTTLLKLTLLFGCFSRFLNCTNGTKSRNARHITKRRGLILTLW